RCEARRRAAVGQLQGGRPDPPGVPAGARGTRGTEPGPVPGGVRAGPRGGRGPPGEGPAGPGRAAATEAAAGTPRLPAAAEGRGQASDAEAVRQKVGAIRHIPRVDLLDSIHTTQAHNGFLNRFLWFAVRRSKLLLFGGQEVDVAPLAARLEDAWHFATGREPELLLAEPARALC